MPSPRLCVSGATVVVGEATATGATVDDGVVVEVVGAVVVDATLVDSSAPAEPRVAYAQYPKVVAAAAPAKMKCRRVSSGSRPSSW
jgi:hypothetical protein